MTSQDTYLTRQSQGLCGHCGRAREDAERMTCRRCRASVRAYRLTGRYTRRTRTPVPTTAPPLADLWRQFHAREVSLPDGDFELSGVTYGRQVAARRIEYP